MKRHTNGMRWIVGLLGVILALCLVPVAANATGGDSTKTLSVSPDGEYKTIQAAINHVNEQEDKTGWTISVASGTYDRFVVLSGLDGLTVKAADGAQVTVNTMNGSVPEGVEFNQGNWMDLDGVQLWNAQNVTLEGLDFVVGTTRTHEHHMSAAVSNHNEAGTYADNFTIRNCTFTGNGDMSGQGNGNVGISISGYSSFTIEGCTFSNLMEGVRGQSDGANVNVVTINGNTFTDCSFAIHEYSGDSDRNDPSAPKGTYSFTSNVVTGNDSLYNKAYFEDQYVDSEGRESNGCTIVLSRNTLENAVFGLVNLEDNGGTTDEVLSANTMNKNSFVVFGSKASGQIELHANYQAPEGSKGQWIWTGKELPTGGGNPETAEETIKAAIEQANAEGSTSLKFGVDDPDNFLLTFTWFKDMIYWQTDLTPDPEPEPEPEPEPSDWDTSKSKTATQLDENYESNVTLSLPSAEEELVSDVVFVLDKSTSTDVRNDAINMLKSLNERIEATDATVKVGVVIFNTEASVVLPLTELNNENLSSIEEAMNAKEGSGTNTHAGMLAGKAMLDDDVNVDANRKHLVLISDGITYMYGETGTVTKGYWMNDGSRYYSADPYSWSFKYGNDEPPADWSSWLSAIGTLVDGDTGENDAPYADKGTFTDGVEWAKGAGVSDYATSVDKALYKTWQVYTDAQASGYHCYAMTKSTSTSYAWGPDFIDYLAGGQDSTFDQIEKEVFYLLDKGSSVVDVIGYGTDNLGADYNFDFVNSIDNLTLTVGGVELNKEAIEGTGATSAYGFFSGDQSNGTYDFELWYYANGQDGNSDECFVWKINVPVSNFAPVQLTYTVKLSNPSYLEGTHGTFDATGEAQNDGLLTNTSATLYPVDTNGGQGMPENFYRPTVSYEVGSVTVRPAEMTIYMGGDQGYDTVVSGSGDSVVAESTNSLPEPGFYIDLSEDLNELLRAAQGTDNTGATDLSSLITFRTVNGDREWKFERYGGDAGSTAYNQFVYRLVPAAGQQPIRLEFTSEDGSTHFTSDDFDPMVEGALYNEYTMGIYAGDVNLNQILMDITINGKVYTKVVNVETSTLNIRYVVDTENGNPVTGVVNDIAAAENPGEKAYAVVSEDATFYINGSQIDLVDGAAPSLLFDSIVSSESGAEENHFDTKLLEKATTVVAAQDESFQIEGHESKYLDLVDANNGNAWLMTDGAVTIYWPYPEGTDETTEFHLTHFQGLDRDMTNDEIDGEIDATEPEYISVTNTEHGVMFTLEPKQGEDGLSRVRFSPFVLVWGASTTEPMPEPEPETPEPVTTGGFTATKTLEGAELKDGQFTFELKDATGKVVGTAKNDAKGNVKFDDMTFKAAGEYEYTISEVNDGQKNVSYDNTVHGVKVVVTEKDGKLEATFWLPEGGVTFTNTYKEGTTTVPTTPTEPTKPTVPTEPAKPADTKKPEVPDTGDPTSFAGVAALLVAGVGAGAAGIVVRHRSK